MARPLLEVDFNELMEPNLIFLSQSDIKKDAQGNDVLLHEGLLISIYSDDNVGADGRPENIVADGLVTRNTYITHFSHVKWCCRIDEKGIRYQA